MKKYVLAIISGIILGVLVVVMPLFMWHRINFPDITPSLSNLRREATRDAESYGLQSQDLQTSLFSILMVSSIASVAVYFFTKRRI